MAVNAFRKFLLLMWKNWLLEKRHWVVLILEFSLPVLFCSIPLVFRNIIQPITINHPTYFKSFLPYSESSYIWFNITFAPDKPAIRRIVETALNRRSVTSFNTTEAMLDYLTDRDDSMGIVFTDNFPTSDGYPDDLKFSLRFPSSMHMCYGTWQTDQLFPDVEVNRPRETNDWDSVPCYKDEGFLALQAAISQSYIKLISNGNNAPTVRMQRFPYPPYKLDKFIDVVSYFLHIILLVSYVSPFGVLVKQITSEKEHQVKELMKMMGLDNWLHWLAWITKSMIFMIIISLIIIILFKIPVAADNQIKVFEHSDPYVLFLVMIIYSFSTTAFAMMLSVFFSKANTAQSISSVAFFVSFIPYNILDANYASAFFAQKIGICFLSNSAFSLIVKFILKLESAGIGLQWNNLFEPVLFDDDISIGIIMVMIAVDSVIYILIALYVERIYPGEYGVPDPWYFPFTKRFWCGDRNDNDSHAVDTTKVQNTQNFEPGPEDKRPGIEIRSLRKVYGRSKVAVSGLTMDMYEDQITALLGHNGAGKTTTMSMLTGLFPPSYGTAFINGCDIRTNIKGVRASLGLCPQKNIIFNDLTVEEHLQFYCSLKGLSSSRTAEEISKYLSILDLLAKRKTLSYSLSGGMKRKLCVAIALCGNSKVVLLDEPTSGMDPAARRILWNLLQQDKKGRTILLSTHFMDEADILGDRIAILSHGDLKACGSSFYLKKRFGVGYHLICEKGPRCNIYSVTKLLQNYVPDIKTESNVGSELSYNIPDEAVPKFEQMLKDFEDNSRSLDIVGYGIAPTTLEEVFFRVEAITTDGTKHDGRGRPGLSDERDAEALELRDYQVDSSILLRGASLERAQWAAMFAKKFYYTIRNCFLLLIHVVMPIVLLVITVISIRSSGTVVQLPSLKINLDTYGTTTTILQSNPTTSKFENEYQNMFGGNKKIVKINEDFVSYILKLGDTIQPEINRRYMVAVSSNEENITAWYNNQGLHTAPLTLNLVYNALAKAVSGKKHTIEVTNDPLPFTRNYIKRKIEQTASVGFAISFSVGVGMCYVSAFFVLFTIKERISRAKLLQFVSGINIFTFWITSFLWDFIIFIGIISLVTITFAILQADGYSTSDQLGRIFIVLVLFAFASIPLSYIFSLILNVPATGYGTTSLIYILIGPIAFITVFGLTMSLSPEEAEDFPWYFRILPHFCMSYALNNLYMKSILCEATSTSSSMDCSYDYFSFKKPGIGADLLFLVIDGCLFISILLLIDYGVLNELFFKIIRKFSRRPTNVTYGPFDDDVLAEKNLVATMSVTEIKSKNLVLKDVTKYYKSFMAVNKLSVAIQKGECFGLLGVNGAGKTSTFKMLTGDESVSSGDIFVQGINFKKHMSTVYKHIGYCPQFDALLEDLSGREIIKIFCMLRGVPYSKIKGITIELAKNLGFYEHLEKRIKEYSGGTKRKLSTALALIGGPDIVYLDEPTTGLDPKSRRQLWDVICKVRDSGKTIVLTSHSMEECEALCTRLAIMVNGEFKCLGSRQHLKNKFSKGLLLIVKVKKTDESSSFQTSQVVAEDQMIEESTVAVEKVKAFVFSTFEGATLKDEYKELLTFFIPQTSIKWSQIFGLMQSKKESLNIEDYSISQTCLEQIFLDFAKTAVTT